jgi:hypothetical protein
VHQWASFFQINDYFKDYFGLKKKFVKPLFSPDVCAVLPFRAA